MKNLLRHIRDLLRSQRGVKVGEVLYRMPLGITVRIDELWMREAIIHLLPETEGAFLDIGVNLGQTLMSLRSIGNTMRYIGFEPNPHCVAAVNQIIDLNEISDTTIIPLACAKRFGVSQLFHYEDSKFDSSASMVKNFRPSVRSTRVSIIASGGAVECLDAIGAGRIGIVKIDVEGFEAEVLEAIEPMLDIYRPLILIEILPRHDDPERMDAGQRILSLIGRLEYVARRIKKTADGRFVGFSEVVDPVSHDEVVHSDYLFAHKSCKFAS